MVARLGGDEFVVLLYGCVHDAVSDVVRAQIRGALAGAPVEPVPAWPVTASIGAALWSPDVEDRRPARSRRPGDVCGQESRP